MKVLLIRMFIVLSVQIARFTIGFSWLYHGIFPKLIHIAPIEKAMTASIGLNEQTAYLLTKSAGVAEVIFGVLFIVLYRSRFIVLANIAALVALLIFVAVRQPHFLIEAFNPVTTNMSLIALSVILLDNVKLVGKR